MLPKMENSHIIRNERIRETLQIIGAVMGVVGVIIAILSLIV